MNRNTTSVILIIIAVGVYFTVTKSMIAETFAIKGVNDQYQLALVNANKLIAVREQIVRKYNSISPEDKDRLDKMIPSKLDNIRLIIDLNNLATRHNFSLSNLKVSAATGGNSSGNAAFKKTPSAVPGQVASSGEGGAMSDLTLGKVNISFGAKLGYDQFITFMRDLESNLRIMDLTHLTMGTSDENNLYTFEVKLQAYWLRN